MKPHQTSEPRQMYNTGSIMMCGPGGVGKTTLFGTLPGKKFAFLFDPNAKDALTPGIDWVEFVPEPDQVAAAAKTLAKDRGDISTNAEPTTYPEYEADLRERFSSGFFHDNKYDWIMIDSSTTLSEIMMDRIQFLAGRQGKHPEQSDWTSEMNLMRSALRQLAKVSRLYLTTHTEPRQDNLTKGISSDLVLTGRNRMRIPLRFPHVLVLEAEEGEKGSTYNMVIQKSRNYPYVRTGLARTFSEHSKLDVTVNFKRPLEGQGLGKYFKL